MSGLRRRLISVPMGYLRLRAGLRASRQYYDETLGVRRTDHPSSHAHPKIVLGVVGGFPALEYVRLGYDWLAPYYNPLLMFDEVHYFQDAPSRINRVDWGYPFYIHHFTTARDIADTCREHNVAILRAYDAVNGRLAIAAARSVAIPVVVSLH